MFVKVCGPDQHAYVIEIDAEELTPRIAIRAADMSVGVAAHCDVEADDETGYCQYRVTGCGASRRARRRKQS